MYSGRGNPNLTKRAKNREHALKRTHNKENVVVVPNNSLLKQPRELIASYDREGVFMYVSYNTDLADDVLDRQRLPTGTGLTHEKVNSWFTFSFGWMLHHTNYATKSGEERILRVKVNYNGLNEIISHAQEAKVKIRGPQQTSPVLFQWESDRDIHMNILPRQVLRLGLRGEVLVKFANEFVSEIVDVTDLAHEIQSKILRGNSELPAVPTEKLLELTECEEVLLDIFPRQLYKSKEKERMLKEKAYVPRVVTIPEPPPPPPAVDDDNNDNDNDDNGADDNGEHNNDNDNADGADNAVDVDANADNDNIGGGGGEQEDVSQ